MNVTRCTLAKKGFYFKVTIWIFFLITGKKLSRYNLQNVSIRMRHEITEGIQTTTAKCINGQKVYEPYPVSLVTWGMHMNPSDKNGCYQR